MTNFSFNMSETGRKIAQLRKERNITQVEMADKLGISYQAVSNWERGESMPDISKLPELAQIFEVSIDEILGNPAQAKIVKKVNENQISELLHDEDIDFEDIITTAPLLKPQQVDNLVTSYERPFTIDDLSGIAPFIKGEILDRHARKISEIEGIGKLHKIAPFISKEVLGELALKASEIDGIDSLQKIAPFIKGEVLDDLVRKIDRVEDIRKLWKIAPFISKELLGELFGKIENAQNN